MYVETIFCENMGPIEKAVIKAGFTPEGNPKPIVLVGKNGSGKSIMLSNIVDALHELGDQAFNNVTKKEGAGHKFFKIGHQSHITLGADHLLGYVSFSTNTESRLEYLYYRGKVTADIAKKTLSDVGVNDFKLNIKLGDTKCVTDSKEKVESAFDSSVIAYFPSYRYAIPDWMGEEYLVERIKNPYQRQFRGELNRPIIVDNARLDTATWVEDVVIDSRVDLAYDEKTGLRATSNVNNALYLQKAKLNVERVLSEILEQTIELQLGYRSRHEGRLSICKNGTANAITPSFDALSTGQTILSEIFITILRYADSINIRKSVELQDIRGIVIIDEIDAHLHTDLQFRVLPKVMKLFPKVQFIVTAHAPLFVLGMEKEYGDAGFDVYEMPECNRISAENYREFQKAFDWLQESKTAQARQRKLTEEAIDAVRSQLTLSVNDEILVVTEGCTDWKHMEHALSKLSSDYPELCGKVRFWHYHPKGKGNGEPEFDMGDTQLVEMCKQFAKIRQPQRMIFISDADNPNVTKSLIVNGSNFKKWGNNVYSFQIPNSEVRQNFSKVCIEHYYTDEVLKTEIEVSGIKRRLFLSHEFNKRTGLTTDGVYSYEYHVKLTENGYDIIEDHVTKVSDRSDHPVNYALPKNDFASEMLAGNQALANVSVEAFRKIFDVVRQIASEPIVTASVANNVSRPIRPTHSA